MCINNAGEKSGLTILTPIYKSLKTLLYISNITFKRLQRNVLYAICLYAYMLICYMSDNICNKSCLTAGWCIISSGVVKVA